VIYIFIFRSDLYDRKTEDADRNITIYNVVQFTQQVTYFVENNILLKHKIKRIGLINRGKLHL